jgi:hypothetical protein
MLKEIIFATSAKLVLAAAMTMMTAIFVIIAECLFLIARTKTTTIFAIFVN